jgi:two-component system, LuxR family, response regulator FixJ
MTNADEPPRSAGKMPEDRVGGSPVVHVIDDDVAVRMAMEMLLHSAGFGVTTHPSGFAFLDALATLGEEGVGCVVTDVRMPGLDGLQLLYRLKERRFRRPVIVMTAHGDISTAVKAMKAGAVDFVEKPFDDEVILAAIGTALKPATVEGPGTAVSRIAELSAREREVLSLLVAGKPNKLIAGELGLSPRTVEVHRARLMTRLGVGSLAEAVRIAVRAELGLPDENDNP